MTGSITNSIKTLYLPSVALTRWHKLYQTKLQERVSARGEEDLKDMIRERRLKWLWHIFTYWWAGVMNILRLSDGMLEGEGWEDHVRWLETPGDVVVSRGNSASEELTMDKDGWWRCNARWLDLHWTDQVLSIQPVEGTKWRGPIIEGISWDRDVLHVGTRHHLADWNAWVL